MNSVRGVARTPQTSKMENFAVTVKGFYSVTVVPKLSFFDISGATPRVVSLGQIDTCALFFMAAELVKIYLFY